MFKFFLYISICICLIYASINGMTAQSPALETLGTGEYCIYSRSEVTSPLITKRINSGIGYIYYCKSTNAAALRTKFTSIDGESITVKNLTAAQILKKLNYKKISSSIDGTVYGYSSRGKSFIRNGSTKINLQISVRSGTATVGWPVILGSY